MKQKLLTLQILNIIGLSNLMLHIMNADFLGKQVFQTGMNFSGILIIGTFAAIIVLSFIFLRKMNSTTSSFFSPILKYAMPNGHIAFLIAALIQGCFFNLQLLKLFLLFSIVFIFPIITYTQSVYILLQGKNIRISDYSDDFEEVNGTQITSIKRVFLGAMYKIKYTDSSEASKAKYFVPSGNLFFFFLIEPASVKALKSIMRG